MIPIYLCEDNPLQLDLLKSMIEKYIFIQAYDMEIRQAVHTPHELLNLLPDQPENAVYFGSKLYLGVEFRTFLIFDIKIGIGVTLSYN